MYELLGRTPHGSGRSGSLKSTSSEYEFEGNLGRPPGLVESNQSSSKFLDITNLVPADSHPISNVGAKPRRHNIFKHRWLWEIAGAVFSVLCIIAVILILATANGKPLSSWSFFVSPNALISIFSTLAKAALMVPVAACISQLKWIYFDKPHTLSELDVFEEASRGPWGSLELVFRLKLKPRALLATWGSVITIVALAMDPFAQQILSFPSHRILQAPSQGGFAFMGSTQLYDTGIPIFSIRAEEVTAEDCTSDLVPALHSDDMIFLCIRTPLTGP
jgi:hypothetical protein